MELSLYRDVEENSESVSDKVFSLVCVLNGLFTQTSRSQRLKVIASVMWFLMAVLWLYWLACLLHHDVLAAEEQVNLMSMVFVFNSVYYSISCLCLRLSFITRNEDFKFILKKRGRKFHDLAHIVVCASSIQVLHVHRFIEARDDFARLHEVVFFFYDMIMMSFFLLYNDAINNILEAQLELKNFAKSTLFREIDNILSEKWKIRNQVKKVNELFATPLVVYYSQLLMVVLFTFKQAVGTQYTSVETAILVVCQCSYLFQLFSVARKGSALAAHGFRLEIRFLKLVPDQTAFEHASILTVLRFREEWDVLQVACFTLSISSFLRFLASCVTCIAVVLQFDSKVVGTINRLSAAS